MLNQRYLFVAGGFAQNCTYPVLLMSKHPPGLMLAKKGVQIYILLYKELTLALKINSVYSKRKLLSIHEYPDHFSAGIYLWSHHEKLVIIDYQICFIGGLDLCFGRYDTFEHKVGDNPPSVRPGKDYYNPSYFMHTFIHSMMLLIPWKTSLQENGWMFLADFSHYHNFDNNGLATKVSTTCKLILNSIIPNSWEDTGKDELDGGKYPRMSWHDVHCELWGPAVELCQDIPLLLHQEAKELDPKSNDKKTVESY
ncbi:hypothetical protein GQ457_14G016290 [Hibiscus cannabinus]